MSDLVDGLRAQAKASLVPTEGTVRAKGLAAPATVRRDRWGVPAIEAASLDDLWFAQGFVTAGERLFQLDLLLRAASGRLSEVFADRTFEDDRFARTIGFRRAAERHVTAWKDDDHRMHARFREGVSAWIDAEPASPIEYLLLDTSPELPDDPVDWAAAFVYLAWSLSNNWDKELLRARIHERLGPEAVDLLMPPSAGGNGMGSNNWAVSSSRTSTGGPLLANDPHLLALQPGAWIEVHLVAPGYRARGVALTFTPGVLLGTTEHHAWGATNVTGDVQDLVLEQLNDDRSAALSVEGWEPLTVRREEIAVRGEPEARIVEIRSSRHGPLLERSAEGLLVSRFEPMAAHETYALRWTGYDHAIRPSLTLAAAKATDWDTFRTAALGVTCPGLNFVYADVGGTIAYQCTGAHPIRRSGDGSRPANGWTDEQEWQGLVPVEALPNSVDPAGGILATANHRVTNDDDPYELSSDFHEPYRYRRILELLASRTDHDVASMAAMQLDTVSIPARETLPLLLERLGATDHGHEAALALLREWDGDVRADSAGAAIYQVWSGHIARRVLEQRLGEALFGAYHANRETFQCRVLPAMVRDPESWITDQVLRDALEDALAELRSTLGDDPDTWRWGAVHTLRLAHPLASIPGLEPLFVAAQFELGGDEQTIAQGGWDGSVGFAPAVIPSWRAVWDLADLDRSVGVLPSGNSGNPGSPHWNDQADLFAQGRTKDLPFTEGALARVTVSTLSLAPG